MDIHFIILLFASTTAINSVNIKNAILLLEAIVQFAYFEKEGGKKRVSDFTRLLIMVRTLCTAEASKFYYFSKRVFWKT